MKNLISHSKYALSTLLVVFSFLTIAEAQLIANFSQLRREEGLIMQRVVHNDEDAVRKCVMNFHADVMDDTDPNSESFNYVYLRATETDNGDNNLALTSQGMLVLGSGQECARIAEVKADADTVGTDIKLYVKGQIAVHQGNATNTIVSDEQYKTNITPLKNSLDVIRKSNFVEYEYNNSSGVKSDRKYYGILAQEMKKVLPNTVMKAERSTEENYKQSTQFYMFNPNDLIYSGLNAIKELDEENQTLKDHVEKVSDQNEALEARVHELEKLLTALVGGKGNNQSSISNTSALSQLYQNKPNPLRESTVIEYYLPDGVSTAFILVQDINGKIITKFDLHNLGLGSINFNARAYNITPGSYTYSLIVDGIPYETKKMMFIE